MISVTIQQILFLCDLARFSPSPPKVGAVLYSKR